MSVDALGETLDALGPIAVAVSGGVDSVTLMAFAHRRGRSRGVAVEAFHAVSPAVPAAATDRLRTLAQIHGWPLTILDAGETNDPEYLRNPVDRCRVCKTHLYDAIHAATTKQVVSGTNRDDLGDYRPGLAAAEARGVRHPLAEAGFTKADVRALARVFALGDLADLPAQPCLSSRIETGIAIEPRMLTMVNTVEDTVRARLGSQTNVRCRVRRSGVVIELDDAVLAALDDTARLELVASTGPALRSAGIAAAPLIESYRMGSAFLRVL